MRSHNSCDSGWKFAYLSGRTKENYFSKTKIYFHKRTTPQLLGHIELQNMKIGEKTNLVDLPLFVWCMLTLALKFVSECSRLKSKFNHISLRWSLKKRKCVLYITILSHCFSFLVSWGRSALWGCKKWWHWYCKVAHRERSWCQQRRTGTLKG